MPSPAVEEETSLEGGGGLNGSDGRNPSLTSSLAVATSDSELFLARARVSPNKATTAATTAAVTEGAGATTTTNGATTNTNAAAAASHHSSSQQEDEIESGLSIREDASDIGARQGGYGDDDDDEGGSRGSSLRGSSEGDDGARHLRGGRSWMSSSGGAVSLATTVTTDESWEFTIASARGDENAPFSSSSALRGGGVGGIGIGGPGDRGGYGAVVSASLRGSQKQHHSSAVRQSANKKSLRLNELTVNKLQFGRLGHLYGRDAELQRLTESWDDVSTVPTAATAAAAGSGARRFVTIRGASGTGKSALAEAIRPSVLRKGGLYLQGKFPQQLRLSRQSVEPYAAFSSACQELCDIVLSLEDLDEGVNGSSSHGSTSSYQDRFPYRKCFKYSLRDLTRKLERELGKDAAVLIKVIPGLKQILQHSTSRSSNNPAVSTRALGAGASAEAGAPASNEEVEADESNFQQAQHQFKFAFRKFVRVLASFGPVVLVLDDLQWADMASMEMVEALLTDREASQFMLVGSYRDDDLYQNMPHLASIKSLQEHAAQDPCLKVEEIPVGNLDVDQVNELLVDLLSSQRPDTDLLAECVHKKTLGNIFFVIQFLTLLQDSDLLAYNFGVMRWRWDVPQIQIQTAATENVVGLMYAKMKGLPDSIGRALPVLACLGSSFTVSVFGLVARRFRWKDDLGLHPKNGANGGAAAHSDDDPQAGRPEQPQESRTSDVPLTAASVLDFCVDQGLIEKAGEEHGVRRYQWVHDKIQEAAFTLVSEDELVSLKLQMGKILYEDFSEEELEANLFTVANLLATESQKDPTSLPRQMPVEVASLYLRAGNKAIEKAAFDQATGYLVAGIGLLPPNHWRDHYQLSLELYSSAAEGFFCTGNFEQMSKHCHEVIRQVDRPILDKRRVYMVLIDATGAAGRQAEALQLCRDVLAKLGHKFPNHAVLLHVLGGIVKTKATLKKTTSHELVAKLPTMDDPEKQLVMAMFDKSVTWMYNTKSDLLPLAVFKGLQMTMKEGVSVYSPVMFALVGFLLSGVVFDFKGGAAFGDQAVELLKQAKGSRKVESRVQFIVHCFTFCWLRPISLSIKPLLAGYEIGMATGDTESGCWCIYFYLEYQFRTGMPLEALIADCAFYAEHVREVKMNNILALLRNLWQVALFLTGANSFDGTFTGELVRQEADLATAGDFHDYLFIAIHRTLMYTQFVLGRHDLVYESIKKTSMDNNGYEKGFPGIAGIYHLYAFNGLSMISLYRETKNKKYLKVAKKFAAKIKTWANSENPNVTHYDSLFDAEFDSLRGATYASAKLYEVAIVYAGRRGLTQDRALAHELFGEHLARLNPAEHGQDAEFQLNEAIKLYTEWGARAKVRLMNEKHSKILAPPSEIEIDVAD